MHKHICMHQIQLRSQIRPMFKHHNSDVVLSAELHRCCASSEQDPMTHRTSAREYEQYEQTD